MKRMISLIFCCAVSACSLLSAEEKPWQILFDGKTLTGWTGAEGKAPGDGWKIADGTLQLAGRGGNLFSQEQYESFELEWHWKISAKGNNGIKYWVAKTPGGEWLGIEYQMIHDGGHHDGKPGSSHSTAAVYDIKAPAADKPLKQPGEWNLSRIVVKDGKIQHFLNGMMVCEIDTRSDEWKERLAKSKFRNKQGFAPGKGYIMLTDHFDPVWYKDIRVRRL